MTDFISDADSPEGFAPKKAPREVRAAPTKADIERMNSTAPEQKLYLIGDEVPSDLRWTLPPEPVVEGITQNEMLEGIEKLLAVRDEQRRKRAMEDFNDPPQKRVMRELWAIQEAMAAGAAKSDEVTDEREEQTGPKTDADPAGVRVATKGKPKSK
jgi:hypothetical protein